MFLSGRRALSCQAWHWRTRFFSAIEGQHSSYYWKGAPDLSTRRLHSRLVTGSADASSLPSPTLGRAVLKTQKRLFESTLHEGEFGVMPAHFIPSHIRRPAYAIAEDGKPLPPDPSQCVNSSRHPNVDCDPLDWKVDPRGEVQSEVAIAKMRRVCRVAANALQIALRSSKPGVTTEEIDRLVHEYIVSEGAYPAAVNFFGFPKAVCASVNEAACHGIPNLRPLAVGDLVTFDCTAYLDGFFGDCAGTALVAPVLPSHKALVDAARECLRIAMAAVQPGAPVEVVGKAIQEFAGAEGLSVVSDFCGHFIGRRLHLPPLVPHGFPNDAKEVFRVGQTFTIEPILTEGSGDVRCWSDGWTAVTQDAGRCAQFVSGEKP